jgi:hypothetical protein
MVPTFDMDLVCYAVREVGALVLFVQLVFVQLVFVQLVFVQLVFVQLVFVQLVFVQLVFVQLIFVRLVHWCGLCGWLDSPYVLTLADSQALIWLNSWQNAISRTQMPLFARNRLPTRKFFMNSGMCVR